MTQADKPTTVYFVRHAKSDTRMRDDRDRPLTPEGLKDAACVADCFKDIPVDHIYSSPYRRAWQTMTELAALKGLDIQPDERFRERRSAGWHPFFLEHMRQLWSNGNYSGPGEENLRMVQKRNIEALNEILESHSGQTIVIGSHGTALSTVIHAYNPDFDYDDFIRIKDVMPWMVRFIFRGKQCLEVEEIPPFNG
ncbi:MAG: histidine phosphatase family protein [Anaerolineaceae bacterium]|jgi:2,3-bisphosphoglycerate-dependent phosphoglycerate mutase